MEALGTALAEALGPGWEMLKGTALGEALRTTLGMAEGTLLGEELHKGLQHWEQKLAGGTTEGSTGMAALGSVLGMALLGSGHWAG